MDEKNYHFDANWYELWMKQSKEFFDTANQNLKAMFAEDSPVNPELHLKEINKWLESLKQQWQLNQLSNEQKSYQAYWNMMNTMCKEAFDLMLEQWIKRSRANDPVTSIRELYELWLKSCHEIYQKSLQNKSYQEVYSQFMNAAFKFWESTIPNK